MDHQHLLSEKKASVLLLTLNRPDSLNAFSSEMITGLTKAFRQADQDEDIKAIVLSGAGRSFSAGGDVKTMGQAGPAEIYEHIGKLNECILSIKAASKPVIAAVHGFAAGAGFNLALACDLIIAADDSRFAMSFSQVGLISDGGGSFFLPRLIGPHLAKEFFFTAEAIPADRLLQMGIVSRIVPGTELREEALAVAEKLASGPVKAYGMMKKLIDGAHASTLEGVLEQERLIQTMMAGTEDHLEGIAAFKEKRKPQFQGK
ncbi:enoyl-CoA hydratase [Bacillus sp. MMSF_3328]|uniref:enoyl-CoA hydratase/isomerase family protein n=1 Tax=Bacillus TaxID=1386 RepID=UPI00273EDC35|nr:enoyl-CoA hydratase [Bacillus sp. MMSF_3328]